MEDNLAWWQGSNNGLNYYWDGAHDPLTHTCACSDVRTCINEHVSCNCDSSAPLWMSDEGVLTDMSVLPVKELSFGGLVFDGQQANFQLGPLSCSGKKVTRIFTKNSAIKQFKGNYL